MNDPYAQLLPYYDAENAGFDDDLHFYLSLMDKGRVLDLGCGTGRLALPLAQHGFEVVGVDRSHAMLKRAQERAKALGIMSVRWLQADLTTLALHQRFDLSILPYNGLLHLLTREQQRSALAVMAAHTSVGGLIVLDSSNPLDYIRTDDHSGFVVERTFTDERGYTVIQQTLTNLDRATQLMDITYIYEYADEQGLLHRDMVPMRFRLVTAPEIELLVEGVLGWGTIFFGDYDRAPYTEDSPRLIVVIERE